MIVGGLSVSHRLDDAWVMVASDDGERRLTSLAINLYARDLGARIEWVLRYARHFDVERLYGQSLGSLEYHSPNFPHDDWLVTNRLFMEIEGRSTPMKLTMPRVPSFQVGKLKEYAAELIHAKQLTLDHDLLRSAWDDLVWYQTAGGAWRAASHTPTNGAITDAIAVFAARFFPSKSIQPIVRIEDAANG